MSKLILILSITLSLLIRVLFILNSTNVADTKLLYQMGEALLSGQNPYLTLSYNIYPPLALYLEAFTLVLANLSSIPFPILSKLWPNLADLLITLLLYKFLIKQKTKPQTAALWSVFYILNPITILISATHGQIDSIVNLAVLASIFVLKIQKKILLSGLLLGLAIAIKPTPIILIPLFLILISSSIKTKLKFTFMTLLPVAISLIPFLAQDPFKILSNLLNYSGVADFGYAAVIRAFFYQDNASINTPFTDQFFRYSKYVLILGLGFIYLITKKSDNLIKSTLLVLLVFITFYFGISGQYLIWILPFAILAKDKLLVPFSLFGTIALLGFYLFFGPDILFGPSVASHPPFQSKFMTIYFFGNLLLWLTTLCWCIKLFSHPLSSYAFFPKWRIFHKATTK